MEPTDLAIVSLGIALGGFIKGATGAGAPVVGVPVLAIVFGVPKAVAIFSVINLWSNIWQAWAYRGAVSSPRFVAIFAISGGIGAALGSILLAALPTEALMAGLALIVLAYITLRLARPDWTLAREAGARIVGPVGLVSGLMQGAGGISAPVSVTFLNAMRLERSEFAATISVFFLSMSAFQIVSLSSLGILTWDRVGLAMLGLVPLFVAMALGERMARHVSKETFDRVILLLLGVVALRLMFVAIG